MCADHSCGVSAGKPGAPRDRSCARRERGDRRSFRAGARGGIRCSRSYARSGPVPLRLTYLVGRSAGPGLRSQGTLGQEGLSRWRARGIIGCRRSYARSGPVPLRLAYLVGRSAGPGLRSQGTLGQVGLSRWCARGIIGCRRSYARSGPVPRLLWAIIGSSGSLRSLGRRGGFREASSGLQLANQGVAGGEDAFVGGNGFRHRAELGC